MQIVQLMELISKAEQSNDAGKMYEAFLKAKEFISKLKETNSNNTELKPIFEKLEGILKDLESGFKLKSL